MTCRSGAGLAMCSASSRPGQDISFGNERLDIAQVSSRLQAQAHTSLDTLDHGRPAPSGRQREQQPFDCPFVGPERLPNGVPLFSPSFTGGVGIRSRPRRGGQGDGLSAKH
jgi:hypothetical protein